MPANHARPRRVASDGAGGRAAGLLTGAVLWPGLPQFIAGNRTLGMVVMTVWAALVTAVGSIWWFFRPTRPELIDLLTSAHMLDVVRAAIVLGAVAWIALFVDAWRLALLPKLSWTKIAAVSLANVLIVALATSGAAFGWSTVSAAKKVVGIFDNEDTKAKSSPLNGRYNILLIGSDTGKNRTGNRPGMRPDSMTIASVDANTGKTVLISLPRNLERAQFKAGSPMQPLFPNGFDYQCDDGCLINAIHTYVDETLGEERAKQLYPNSSDPGLDATIDAVEGTTGLTINYHILVNMRGLVSLVNAVGGVTIDLHQKIAMFGHDDPTAWLYEEDKYIPAGTHKLTGKQALWYARSRIQSDDYTRMGRQKCLMNAMLQQLDPVTVLTNAADIASASSKMVQTDIPASELSAFAAISDKTRKTPIASLGIVPPTYDVVHPDIAQIQADVAAAIRRSEATPTHRRTPTQAPSSVSATTATPTTPAPTSTTDGKAANDTTDLESVC